MKRNRQSAWYVAPIIVGSLLLASCASQPPRGGNVVDDINQSLQESVEQSTAFQNRPMTPPSAISDALLPPMNVELSGISQAPIERRFDITVNRANARTFFMSLVEGTTYNMVAHPGIKGKISLSLKNVTVDEVMETVRNVYGFEYKRTRNGYEVLPAKLRSRVFTLDYLNVKRSGLSKVRVSSGQVSSVNDNDSNSNNSDSGNSDASSTRKTTDVSGSQVSTESESDFWMELTETLQSIIGNEEGRKVVINPQSGIVVVRAMPSELREVSKYLSATQNVIERQVILEAKILEVELSDGFQSGVNWAAMSQSSDGDGIVAGQFGGSSIFENGVSGLRGRTDALNPGDFNDIGEDVARAFGGIFAMGIKIGDFRAFIELLETQGDVHVLSSPRVSTMNNQKAVIKVGTDEFFVTDVDTNDNTNVVGATTNQSVDIELTPFFSGVALDVIPQISEDGVVTLHIHPSVSQVDESIKQINITTDNELTIPLAKSTIRESDSIVRARSGQVVVIGGLMQNVTRDQTSSVPLLGDLPVVGSFFQHQKQVTRKSELVILLRPMVVANDKIWLDEVQKVTGRFGDITKVSQ